MQAPIDGISSFPIFKNEIENRKKMKKEFNVWYKSVQKSVNGQDYPKGKLFEQPSSNFWMNDNKYKPFIKEWINRP